MLVFSHTLKSANLGQPGEVVFRQRCLRVILAPTRLDRQTFLQYYIITISGRSDKYGYISHMV